MVLLSYFDNRKFGKCAFYCMLCVLIYYYVYTFENTVFSKVRDIHRLVDQRSQTWTYLNI